MLPHHLDPLSDVAVVEQAKGVLMLRYGVGPRESLAVLERWAAEAETSLRELAHTLVSGICLGLVTPESTGVVRWLEHRLRGDVEDVREASGEASRTPAAHAVPAPAPGEGSPEPGPRPVRQWRYSSAVHAARVLRTR